MHHGKVERTKVLVEREVGEIVVNIEEESVLEILRRLCVRHPVQLVYIERTIRSTRSIIKRADISLGNHEALTLNDFDRLAQSVTTAWRLIALGVVASARLLQRTSYGAVATGTVGSRSLDWAAMLQRRARVVVLIVIHA